MLALFLANTQGVGPTGLIVLGGFCFLIGVWFSIAIVSNRLRAIFRWVKMGVVRQCRRWVAQPH